MLEIALGKLEKEFRRLLAEESQPVQLPEHLAPQVEDGSSTSSELESFVIYSPAVLQRLQAIVAKLAGTDQYQRCVDAYQETRNAQCNLSLQVSSYLLGHPVVLFMAVICFAGGQSSTINIVLCVIGYFMSLL